MNHLQGILSQAVSWSSSLQSLRVIETTRRFLWRASKSLVILAGLLWRFGLWNEFHYGKGGRYMIIFRVTITFLHPFFKGLLVLYIYIYILYIYIHYFMIDVHVSSDYYIGFLVFFDYLTLKNDQQKRRSCYTNALTRSAISDAISTACPSWWFKWGASNWELSAFTINSCGCFMWLFSRDWWPTGWSWI